MENKGEILEKKEKNEKIINFRNGSKNFQHFFIEDFFRFPSFMNPPSLPPCKFQLHL
jgi:hypothetical protein